MCLNDHRYYGNSTYALLTIGSLLSNMLESCLRELGRDRTSVSSSTSGTFSLVRDHYLTCVFHSFFILTII